MGRRQGSKDGALTHAVEALIQSDPGREWTTDQAMAAELGVTDSAVSYARRSLGRPSSKRYHQGNLERNLRALLVRRPEMTNAAMARALGVDGNRVRKMLAKWGVPTFRDADSMWWIEKLPNLA